jgi:hypothetical protein
MITQSGHEWMYYKGLPPALAGVGDDPFRLRPFWDFQVIRDETVPGFSGLSSNAAYGPDTPGRYNQYIKWSSSWDAWDGKPIDEADRWQMSFCSTELSSRACGGTLTQSVDITPRRLQRFRVTPGAAYDWENRRVRDDVVVSRGTLTAGSDGLITVPGFEVTPSGNRLLLKPH